MRQKSRSKIRKVGRVPGGRLVLKHFRRKIGNHKCSDCGVGLKGVSHTGSLSYKKPSRMHAGNLCSQCVKAIVLQMVEGMVN